MTAAVKFKACDTPRCSKPSVLVLPDSAIGTHFCSACALKIIKSRKSAEAVVK